MENERKAAVPGTVGAVVRFSDHEKRILSSMEMDVPYFGSDFVRMGFKRGVQSRTMNRLRALGFIRKSGLPVKGHEHDWRETGHYYSVYRKVKEHETWTYTI